MKKYLKYFLVSCKNEFYYPYFLIARAIFMIIIIYIFSLIWAALQVQGFSDKQLILYLLIAESIALSIPQSYHELGNSIKTGDYAYQLLRPVNYFNFNLVSDLAKFVIRFIVNFCLGLIFCGFLVGFNFDLHFLQTTLSILISIMSGILSILFINLIGMQILYLYEVRTLYIIWQKFLMLFGGILFPVTFYPEVLQSFVKLTPFYAIIYLPANLFINFSINQAFYNFLILSFWIVLIYLITLKFQKIIFNKQVILGG